MKALEILYNINVWGDVTEVEEQINEAIIEIEELENRSCKSCKYCYDDCDEDGEWYCEERFKHIELDFRCSRWKAK